MKEITMSSLVVVRSFIRVAVLGAMVLAAASCKSGADKAADLVKQGTAFEQVHNDDAARNAYLQALDLDPESIDARRALAALNYRVENMDAARAQYSAIRDRLPNDIEANLALAEIALIAQNTDLATSYADVAFTTAPDMPRTRGVRIALDFYAAVAANNEIAIQDALTKARELLVTAPEIFTARRIVIQSLMSSPKPVDALPEIEIALKTHPESLELNMMKLNVLSRQKNAAAAVEQMKLMYKQFPANREVEGWLHEWYLSKGTPAETVAFLRDLAARHADDRDQHRRIADYVATHFVKDDALAELERLASSYKPRHIADIYRAREAQVLFDAGQRDEAVTLMRDIMAKGRPLSQAPYYRTVLAEMLDHVGRREEARAIVDDVLNDAPTTVAALKLRAGWLIEEEDYSGAISALRIALTADPKDPVLMTMIADAYEKTGTPELAGRSLADAVELTQAGVKESLLYAQFLMRTGDSRMAALTLANALQAHPGNAEILAYVREGGIDLSPSPAP